MSYVLALAGSTSKSHILLCRVDGEFLAAKEYPGIHLRGIRQDALTDHIERAVGQLIEVAGIRRTNLLSQSTKISVALSGIDHRFEPDSLLGSFGTLGFAAANDQSLVVHGLSEAVYRA